MVNIGDSFSEKGKGALTVVSFHKGKFLRVKCSLCNGKHSKFYPEYFEYHERAFEKKVYPCGCRKGRRLPKELNIIIVEDFCKELGYDLVFYEGHGYAKIHNPCSGNTWYSRLSDIKRGNRDPALKYEIHRKSDEYFIESFYNTGSFETGTIFCRGDRKTNQGSRNYWNVKCPLCFPETKSIYEGFSSSLLKGQRPCDCYKNFGFYGWYKERKDEIDNLYFMKVLTKGYFKVGRSFDVNRRFYENKSRIDKVYGQDTPITLSEYLTADHLTIFNLEQLLIGKNANPVFDGSYPSNGYGSSEIMKDYYYDDAVGFAREYLEEWWK